MNHGGSGEVYVLPTGRELQLRLETTGNQQSTESLVSKVGADQTIIEPMVTELQSSVECIDTSTITNGKSVDHQCRL